MNEQASPLDESEGRVSADDRASTSGTHRSQETISFDASPGFSVWLVEQQISLALTTYQAGKLILVGTQPGGQLSIFERTFNRCMGLWSDGQTLWMSSLFQLWRFENLLQYGQVVRGYDRLYVPQVSYVTGELDVHDVTVESNGRVVFVNTRFGCLSTISDRHSFLPLWKPPFISELVAEDRCHLNGLAVRDGSVRYATAVAPADSADAWRERRCDGGCLIDVQSNELLVTGLSMPHSPRFYRDKIWLLNSGTGFLGSIDPGGSSFEPLTFCPGYLRGLAFVGDYAVVGLSLPRDNRAFSGLDLDQNLIQRSVKPICGVQVIDLNRGELVHWMQIEGIVSELYDVVCLPDVGRPMALGLRTNEIRRILSMGAPESPSNNL